MTPSLSTRGTRPLGLSFAAALLAVVVSLVRPWAGDGHPTRSVSLQASPVADLQASSYCRGTPFLPVLELTLHAGDAGGSRDRLLTELAFRASVLSPSGCAVWTDESGRILVQVAEAPEPNTTVAALIGSTTFAMVNASEANLAPGSRIQVVGAPGTPVAFPVQGTPSASPEAADAVAISAVLTQDDIASVAVREDLAGRQVVAVTLLREAALRFESYTAENAGELLAIVVDGTVVSTLIVQGAIGPDQALVIADLPYETPDIAAQRLRFGTLPAPVEVVQVLRIDAEAITTDSTALGEREPACWTDAQRTGELGGKPQFSSPPAQVIDPSRTYEAVFTTSVGTFTLDLLARDAPETVNNFVCLARDGYFDGIVFHRVVAGFVVQTGDPTGTGGGGPGYKFDDEPPTMLNYERGTVAMANAGPDTNGSQFFVCLSDLTQRLPKNYAIFGTVTTGMDVIDAIGGMDVEPNRTGEMSSPVEPVVIRRVIISET